MPDGRSPDPIRQASPGPVAGEGENRGHGGSVGGVAIPGLLSRDERATSPGHNRARLASDPHPTHATIPVISARNDCSSDASLAGVHVGGAACLRSGDGGATPPRVPVDRAARAEPCVAGAGAERAVAVGGRRVSAVGGLDRDLRAPGTGGGVVRGSCVVPRHVLSGCSRGYGCNAHPPRNRGPPNF